MAGAEFELLKKYQVISIKYQDRSMHNFKELKVWRAGIEVSKSIFSITRNFPGDERYGLISQMTRAAVSIPSNIAEGCGRKSNKELHQFLNISLGSALNSKRNV
nr:four helix bundle protein [Mucilaginibacter terrigena]